MSDTPQTDAVENEWRDSWSRRSGREEMAAIARKMERQNAVLRNACAEVLEEVGDAYLVCKPQLSEAVEACQHPGELWDVERIIELLEKLSRYPVEKMHPDGPCIKCDDMDEILDILGHNTENETPK